MQKRGCAGAARGALYLSLYVYVYRNTPNFYGLRIYSIDFIFLLFIYYSDTVEYLGNPTCTKYRPCTVQVHTTHARETCAVPHIDEPHAHRTHTHVQKPKRARV